MSEYIKPGSENITELIAIIPPYKGINEETNSSLRQKIASIFSPHISTIDEDSFQAFIVDVVFKNPFRLFEYTPEEIISKYTVYQASRKIARKAKEAQLSEEVYTGRIGEELWMDLRDAIVHQPTQSLKINSKTVGMLIDHIIEPFLEKTQTPAPTAFGQNRSTGQYYKLPKRLIPVIQQFAQYFYDTYWQESDIENETKIISNTQTLRQKFQELNGDTTPIINW